MKIAVLLLALPLVPALAQEKEPERPWTDTAELSLINATGNTRTTNVSFANKYVYTWEKADFTGDAAALWAETDHVKSAESYSLAGKYRRNITERFLWYGIAGWSRNEFAGFDDRYNAGAGVGYRFLTVDPHSLVGELGLGYTSENRIPPFPNDSWAEARAFLGYGYKISETSKLDAEIEAFDNLDETSDWRGHALASITSSLSKKLALRASYKVLHDNVPVPGFKKTDTISSASLVVNF